MPSKFPSAVVIVITLLMTSTAWCQTNSKGWPTRENESSQFGPLQPAIPSQQKKSPSQKRSYEYSIPVNTQDRFGETFVSTKGSNPESADTTDPLKQKIQPDQSGDTTPLGTMSRFQSAKPMLKVVGGLSLVLAIFYALVVFAKRNGGSVNGKVPEEVIQVLGQVPMDSRRHLQLVRLGSKILLLSVTNSSVESIGEIDDPVEVEHVISTMQRGRAVEDFQNFRRITNQIRQQRRAQRMYPSQMNGELEDEPTQRRASSNVFEA